MRAAEEVRAAALSYISSHQVMTLATSGADGVWAAAVFYASDGFDFIFLSASHTRHGVNLAANKRVAATIQDDDQDWSTIRGIQLEGSVFRLEGKPRGEAIAHYRKKFPFVGEPTAALQAALRKVSWYRLETTRLFFIDNRRGFGHRDEIDPRRG
jgi:uncharacterized protein YhbP (UPF0306 family)